MDINYILNILKRRRWLILLCVLIPAIATFLFVSSLPYNYKSEAKLSTGIIDFKGMNVAEDAGGFLQQFQIDMTFSNLKQFMESRKAVKFLTFSLLIHDLNALDGRINTTPFRIIKEDEDFNLSNYNTGEMVKYMETQLADLMENNVDDKIEMEIQEVAKAFEYDHEAILKQLSIERLGDADYMGIDFLSENPALSHFSISTYCDEFLRYYEHLQTYKYKQDVDFYTNQVNSKKALLDRKTDSLASYRKNKNLIHINAQQTSIVNQITQLELAREEANKGILGKEKVINDLNNYMQQNKQTEYNSAAQEILTSETMIRLKRELQELITLQAASENPASYNQKVLLKQRQMDAEIKKYAATQSKERDETKNLNEDLLQQRIDAEIELSIAREGVKSYDTELNRLRTKANALVSDDSFVGQLGSDISLLESEFLGMTKEMNIARLKLQNANMPVQLIQTATFPDKPENKLLPILTAFAGIVGGTIACVAIFLGAFFDTTLNNPHQFTKFADVSLIGSLNELPEKDLDLKYIFSTNGENPKLVNFKESIRKIRYWVESSDARTFLFSSTKEQEGKTFLIVTLAYALTLKNKKVLLIDTNFKNNSITKMSKRDRKINFLHTRLIGENNLASEFESKRIKNEFNLDHVDIIGNMGGSKSPSEILAGKDFKNFIEELKKEYDYIFLEAPSLNKYSDARELVEFVDKIIAVFSAKTEIKVADKASLGYLRSLNEKFMGAILNKVDVKNMN